jgi:tetratricopeptide (TPR) repeat protein
MKRFKNADALFSLLPKTRVRMAQLAAITQHEGGLNNHQQEFAHIDEALSRSTPKTQTLFSCGLLALNSGNQDLAVELWRKCLRQPHLFAHEKVIVELCLQMVPMRRLYEEIFPQDPKYLIRMAGRYMRSPEMMLPKKFLVVHIKCLIEQSKDLSELEKKVFLARAARHVNDYPAVAANYRAALSLASELAPWRYDYAFALFKTKQFDEAVRQLKLCELDPTFPKNRTKQLLKRIRTARSNP